ncbi:hypothetical protein BD779DRAFT_1650769 [Infundibulicybe gibba]|nr:hypothetical protein BD779DRAFT_1650769 [Infundibulicybe gibba]
MRPVVSYDDITLPYQPAPKPPPKKQKRNNSKQVHRVNRASDSSRELTHEEIWDDSALIDAWNATTEEYTAMNGPEKDWKREHTSPLWYNVPLKPAEPIDPPSTNSPFIETKSDGDTDSKPIDFDSFIPSHNPTLNLPAQTEIPEPDYALSTPAHIVSQDEAFQRALSAMYWGGYWTAMYHCQRNTRNEQVSLDEVIIDNTDKNMGGENEEEQSGEDEDFVPPNVSANDQTVDYGLYV